MFRALSRSLVRGLKGKLERHCECGLLHPNLLLRVDRGLHVASTHGLEEQEKRRPGRPSEGDSPCDDFLQSRLVDDLEPELNPLI